LKRLKNPWEITQEIVKSRDIEGQNRIFTVKKTKTLTYPWTKVVKIAFWLVKSYDFTSQNMLCVLNRLKKIEMGEIELKSGEIVKIRWNREKSRFQGRFHDFNKMHALKQNVPPMLQLSGAYWLCKCTITRSSLTADTCGFCLHTIKKWRSEIKRAAKCNSDFIPISFTFLCYVILAIHSP